MGIAELCISQGLIMGMNSINAHMSVHLFLSEDSGEYKQKNSVSYQSIWTALDSH